MNTTTSTQVEIGSWLSEGGATVKGTKYDQKLHGGRSSAQASKSKKWKRPRSEFGETMDDQYDRWLEKEQARNRRQHP